MNAYDIIIQALRSQKVESYLNINYCVLPLQYFALNMISCASDLTMEFDWIRGNVTHDDPNLSHL